MLKFNNLQDSHILIPKDASRAKESSIQNDESEFIANLQEEMRNMH